MREVVGDAKVVKVGGFPVLRAESDLEGDGLSMREH